MADGISFDLSEATQLAADFGEVPASAGPLINSAMQGSAFKVKKSAQESVKGGSPRWKAAPNAIDYDVNTFHGFGASVLKVDIGYNKGRRGGGLGNLREFGAPGKGLGPHNDLADALEKNSDDFQRGLEQALIDAERVLTNSTGIGHISRSVIRGSY